MVTGALFAAGPTPAALAAARHRDLEARDPQHRLLPGQGEEHPRLLPGARRAARRQGAASRSPTSCGSRASAARRPTWCSARRSDSAEGVVVDTHVGRISRRLGLTRHADAVRAERDLVEVVPREHWIAFSHRLIEHGRAVCAARSPRCDGCPLADLCPRGGREAAGGPAATTAAESVPVHGQTGRQRTIRRLARTSVRLRHRREPPMILSGNEIKQQLGGNIVIDPFDESRLNPNSYNLSLHDELLVYEEVVLDMRKSNRVERIADPRGGARAHAQPALPRPHRRADGDAQPRADDRGPQFDRPARAVRPRHRRLRRRRLLRLLDARDVRRAAGEDLSRACRSARSSSTRSPATSPNTRATNTSTTATSSRACCSASSSRRRRRPADAPGVRRERRGRRRSAAPGAPRAAR